MTEIGLEKAWADFLQKMKQEQPQEVYELWFSPLKLSSLKDGILTIVLPNKFFADQIEKRFRVDIETFFTAKLEERVRVAYEFSQVVDGKMDSIQQEPIEQPREENVFTVNVFNPKYTLDTFVVGPSNRFAEATSEAVAKEPGRAYNPLFIYGGVGLGKTHLLNAIGHYIKQNTPVLKVLYVSSERFINDFIESVRQKTFEKFRSKYRSLDCLLIDDIQFLTGKEQSQEEFFYTFNSLFESHKQIVITSDRPPKELPTLEERLISRFEWGVVADIKPPDLETRIAILRKKAELEKLVVHDEVILFLAGQIKTNIRELEGALIRVVAFSSLLGTEITVESAKEILNDILPSQKAPAEVTIERIQRIVAKEFNLNVSEMKSKRRTDSVAFPRQVAMYLSRTLTECSLTEIGEAFGGKDHTTIMHACNKIKAKINNDCYFLALVNKITTEIREGKDLNTDK
ncbi:MAG: chromosomal replication initiator protein DnaA [Elusimicrobiota bacterium]